MGTLADTVPGAPSHVTATARRALPTLDQLAGQGQRVLVRVDYNVPLEDGQVTDDSRIRASRETIDELRDRGAAVILMSHLGRPKDREESLRMAPVAEAAARVLECPIQALDQVVGAEVTGAARALAPGAVMMLENLRFEPGEKANDDDLARQLAAVADAYVNDAFGTAHRAAASTVGVVRHLPGYAGRLMERELAVLGKAVDDPERPFVVILGGAKVSDKLGVLHNLLPKADALLLGGGMANTFLAAKGVAMAESLVEPDRLSDAAELLRLGSDRILLPVDLVAADEPVAAARHEVVAVADGVPPGRRALDVGPGTVESYRAALAGARTVVWNGPLGMFEIAPFGTATTSLARVVADLAGAQTIAGGGDLVAALTQAGVAERIGWISTGGGAMLTLLAGAPLPAVDALRR